MAGLSRRSKSANSVFGLISSTLSIARTAALSTSLFVLKRVSRQIARLCAAVAVGRSPAAKAATRSPSHIEPVSGMPKRKLESGERRLAPQCHRVHSRKSGIRQSKTRARPHNPRECRQFSHHQKTNWRDRTGLAGVGGFELTDEPIR
jgi:hypothetical protein